MKTVFIYALCEPGTRTIRYIGKTDDLKRRLREHLSTSSKFMSPLGEWLRGLSGSLPDIIVLCETSLLFWQDDETREIRSARAFGAKLVNSSDGGEGGINPTPETLIKMSAAQTGERNHNFGKKASMETRAIMSAARTGDKHPMFGKHPSLETRAKQRAAKLGKKASLETRAKQSKVRLGKKLPPHSLEARFKMSVARMGKRPSSETRARQSAARMGDKNPNFGKKASPEKCAKISAALKGRALGKPWTAARRAAFESKKVGTS